MNPPFLDQIAVVTGAGGTLCSEIAVELARGGAHVALLGRTPRSLEPVAAAIAAVNRRAVICACDVTDAASVEAARATIERELGPAHLLINGAGGNQPAAVTTLTEFDPAELAPDQPGDLRGFFNLDLAAFDSVLRTNTLGTVIPCRVFGRDLAQLRRGAILNFASMNSYRPLSRVGAYGMAKAGVVNFTQWLAAYLAPAHVRVNAVAPGFFVNDRSRKILLDDTDPTGLTARGRNVLHHTPAKRFGQPHDLLGCVTWLLDDARAAFVTGQCIAVDGGFLASSGV